MTEALATFLKERVRKKGREAGEVSRAPPLPGRGQRGVISPPALGDI